jgi:hypothetical protein
MNGEMIKQLSDGERIIYIYIFAQFTVIVDDRPCWFHLNLRLLTIEVYQKACKTSITIVCTSVTCYIFYSKLTTTNWRWRHL